MWVARVGLRLLRVLATLLALAAVVVLAAVAVGPRLGLYRMETVLSGSMQPTFSPGDVIIVTPEPVTAVGRARSSATRSRSATITSRATESSVSSNAAPTR